MWEAANLDIPDKKRKRWKNRLKILIFCSRFPSQCSTFCHLFFLSLSCDWHVNTKYLRISWLWVRALKTCPTEQGHISLSNLFIATIAHSFYFGISFHNSSKQRVPLWTQNWSNNTVDNSSASMSSWRILISYLWENVCRGAGFFSSILFTAGRQ